MKIEFKERNEEGLHCRFCKATYWEGMIDLYETLPVKGIVCEFCRRHLENYITLKN